MIDATMLVVGMLKAKPLGPSWDSDLPERCFNEAMSILGYTEYAKDHMDEKKRPEIEALAERMELRERIRIQLSAEIIDVVLADVDWERVERMTQGA